MTRATSADTKFTQEIKDFVAYWKANDKKLPVFVKGVSGTTEFVPVDVSYNFSTDAFVLTPLVNINMLDTVLQGSNYEYGLFVLKCATEVYHETFPTISGIQSGGGSQ